MKKIILHSLTLTNWRGEKQRTTNFNTSFATCIQGANAVGKSRHFDAFCWLLFGKDSRDRKDFELRTYDANHEPLHHCECSVSAVISVDGTTHDIKREYKELWVKPRGQVEEVFKGNVTECTWDGVPVKVGDFQKRIAENIIDETVFKMITNPRYFCEKMKWQLQRETLMQMAGTKTDDEIASGNDDFKRLLDTLDGKSLDDFRKEVAAAKKRLKAEKDDIGPRIDQTRKMMPKAEPWDKREKQQDELRRSIDEITSQIEDCGKRDEAAQQQIAELQCRIYDLQFQQDKARQDYGKKLNDDVERQNDARHDIEMQCKEQSSINADNNIDIQHTKERIAYLNAEITDLASQLDKLRQEWYSISKSQYDGSDICPHCGQRLPESMIADAKTVFENHKQEQLKANNESGKALSAQRKSYADELNERQNRLTELMSKKELGEKKMQQLYGELDKHPLVKVGTYLTKDIPGWEDCQKQIDDLNEQIGALKAPRNDSEAVAVLREKRTLLQHQYHEVAAVLNNRTLIENGKREIENLQNRGKELAQLIADLEKKEYTAAQFSKKKIEDCEKRINSMFHLVRFQLFDYTQDGNEYETCVPLVDGVPYPVANTASQINAGLDIINTLCRFNNVSAPIFCDGAESVNRYIDTQSQMIYLLVTNDKELVIK